MVVAAGGFVRWFTPRSGAPVGHINSWRTFWNCTWVRPRLETGWCIYPNREDGCGSRRLCPIVYTTQRRTGWPYQFLENVLKLYLGSSSARDGLMYLSEQRGWLWQQAALSDSLHPTKRRTGWPYQFLENVLKLYLGSSSARDGLMYLSEQRGWLWQQAALSDGLHHAAAHRLAISILGERSETVLGFVLG